MAMDKFSRSLEALDENAWIGFAAMPQTLIMIERRG
jgi:hypothetical protein